jgi:hypothetical protein
MFEKKCCESHLKRIEKMTAVIYSIIFLMNGLTNANPDRYQKKQFTCSEII